MNSGTNTQQCAMMEQGGRCCEGIAALKPGCYTTMHLFGVLVLVGIALVIMMQGKILKELRRGGKKK